MKNIILVDKPITQTPLEVIQTIKNKYTLTDKKIAYAGRLDPMASGLLLLLIEPETKNRKLYERLPKEYIFEILFGVSSDTYDILGLTENTSFSSSPPIIFKNLRELAKKFIGTFFQTYPPYSSPRINGKPLFVWAREGRISEITIPEKEITIYSLELLKIDSIEKTELKKEIIKRIKNVSGDFRQEKISTSWNNFFETTNNTSFRLAQFKISCSSGTYVRSLAYEFGKIFKVGALAYSIRRTKIGDFDIKDAVKIDSMVFTNL